MHHKAAQAYQRAYQTRRRDGHDGLYDDYSDDIAHLARILAAPYVPARASLLALGCGAGNLALWLAQRGFAVAGIDISPHAIAWARQKAADQQLHVDFRVGDATDLSAYADQQFDMVLDEYCLHFLLEPGRGRCLDEIYRVLRPSGLFLMESICLTGQAERAPAPIEQVEIAGIAVPRYVGPAATIMEELMAHGFAIQHAEIAPYSDDPSRGDLSLHAIKARR